MDDIGTEDLPLEVVNEDFVLIVANKSMNSPERLGQTSASWCTVEYTDEQAIQVAEWIEFSGLTDKSADQLEFSGKLLQYWADRLLDEAASARELGL